MNYRSKISLLQPTPQILSVQSNGYDCRVWVLAQIAVILQGYDVLDIQEDAMVDMRQFMYSLCCRLPLQ